MSEKSEYTCLLGINPKEVQKCNSYINPQNGESTYIVQRIECTEVVDEWRFNTKRSAKTKWKQLNENPNLYPRLIVNGVPFTIGQAERFFRG